jgi:thiosulfate/3-mercaptopyruvate sulfurtransferase
MTNMAKNKEIDMASSAIVSVRWLYDHLKKPDVKILDASWYMPIEQRNSFEEFKNRRIPGALFFDIDAIGDLTTDLPHMLPSESAFAAAVSALGIQNTDEIVVYDGKGLYSAARVWWMFRVFGHEQIVVLDGGLPQWIGSGYEVETGAPASLLAQIQAASQAVRSVYQAQQVDSLCFKASFQPHVVWSLDQVRCNIEEKTSQLIDARSKGRLQTQQGF